MPLIVLCGYPSSGKTTTTSKLKEFFEKKNIKVKVISENFLVDEKKNEIYSGEFDQSLFRNFILNDCNYCLICFNK